MIYPNGFGSIFRVNSFGESHGVGIGVVVDGCPAGLKLDLDFIQSELDRRKPGQSKLVSPRKEEDKVEVYSGLFEGITTGMPLMLMVLNGDAKSKDYSDIKDLFRPGHADYTYFAKYGYRDYRGGGRSSARETIGRVIAGAIAKQLLSHLGVSIRGGLVQVGNVLAKQLEWDQVEANDARFLDSSLLPDVEAEIKEARLARDSVGAVIQMEAYGVPVGLGDPAFARLDALLAWAMMSIPAVKGVEVGGGFSLASRRGSEANDQMDKNGFLKNDHGGTLGGISTGAPIVLRFAVKPTSSIPREQNTVNTQFEETVVSTLGRHDPCVGIRAVPIAESMIAITLLDCWLRQSAATSLQELYLHRDAIDYPKA